MQSSSGEFAEDNVGLEDEPSVQDEFPVTDSQAHGNSESSQEALEDVEVDNPDADLSDFIARNSAIMLPGLSISRLQAMLLVLTFVVTAGLPWTQVDGLLKLLNAIFGKEVFPSSKYGFRKLWDLQKSKMVNVHTYCSTCHFLTEAHGLNEQHCRICSKVSPLSELLKKGSFFIVMDLKTQLQQLLRRTGNIVGSNLQKLAASVSTAKLQDLTDGALYRKMRSEQKMRWSDLTLTLNTDGSPVFKSSKGSVWPIQVTVNELPVPLRWKNILIAAVWFSKEHPPTHLFLKAFVDRFQGLGNLTWSFADQVVRSAVRIVCCCVDSPARAALLNAKQYNGYYGCSWCLQKGALIAGKAAFSNRKMFASALCISALAHSRCHFSIKLFAQVRR